MDCTLVRGLLPNHLEDELAEEVQREVEAHVIRCRACAWEVESIRRTVGALRRSVAPGGPRPGFRERLLGQLLRDHRAAAARRPQGWGAEPPVFVLDLNQEGARDGQ